MTSEKLKDFNKIVKKYEKDGIKTSYYVIDNDILHKGEYIAIIGTYKSSLLKQVKIIYTSYNSTYEIHKSDITTTSVMNDSDITGNAINVFRTKYKMIALGDFERKITNWLLIDKPKQKRRERKNKTNGVECI